MLQLSWVKFFFSLMLFLLFLCILSKRQKQASDRRLAISPRGSFVCFSLSSTTRYISEKWCNSSVWITIRFYYKIYFTFFSFFPTTVPLFYCVCHFITYVQIFKVWHRELLFLLIIQLSRGQNWTIRSLESDEFSFARALRYIRIALIAVFTIIVLLKKKLKILNSTLDDCTES